MGTLGSAVSTMGGETSAKRSLRIKGERLRLPRLDETNAIMLVNCVP